MMDRNAYLLGVEADKAASVTDTLKRFATYFRPYRWLLLIILILIIINSVLTAVVFPLFGQAVDCYLQPTLDSVCWYDENANGIGVAFPYAVSKLGDLVILVIGLFFFGSLTGGLAFHLMSVAGYQVLADMRREIFAQTHRLSLGYFSKNEAGDLMSRFTNDTSTLEQIMGFGLVQVLQSLLTIIALIAVMFWQNVPMTILALITLPIMYWFTQFFSRKAREAFRSAREELGNVNADLQENISAVREVQAFNREEENIEQFRESSAATRDANIRAQAFSTALAPTLEALTYVNMAVVAGVGGYYLLNNRPFFGALITGGLIVSFIGQVQQFNRPLQQVSLLWTNLQSAIAGGERIFSILDEVPDVVDKPDAKTMPEIVGNVSLNGVWSEYNKGEPVLKGINLEVEAGQTVAIVGPTGAGKTTIINLLPRFWDVTEGAIKIDGIDVRDVTRKSLRQQIGIVLQDTFLFSDTVMNNIRYGRPEASDEEVKEAAKLARAHHFIEKLEHGYETVLGERGSGLSQGQRQLLSIARVALVQPKLLIMDEATSSVDTRTEREIQAALEKLLAGQTSFVIAHRLSTIRNADVVLYLKDGVVEERGSHDELMALEGAYYDLYMSQFKRESA